MSNAIEWEQANENSRAHVYDNRGRSLCGCSQFSPSEYEGPFGDIPRDGPLNGKRRDLCPGNQCFFCRRIASRLCESP